MKSKTEGILKKLQQNQFGLFIGLSLAIAFGLIGSSLWLYNEGGTAQLDLSRPSYQEAREQQKREAAAEKDKAKKDDFASDGKLDRRALDEFKKSYKNYANKIDGEFFAENPLSDQTLNLNKTEEK